MNAVGITDTTTKFSSGTVATGSASGYQSAKGQSYTVGISATDGSLGASTETIGLSANVSYTLLAFDRLGAVNTYTLVDTQTTPSSGFTSLTVANATGDAGTLDVYLVAPNQSLANTSPSFASVSTESTFTPQSFTSGTYDIVVTAAGKPADRRLTISGARLVSGDVITLALTSTLGGGLVNGAIVHQGAGLEMHPVNVARVRVVGAFPAGATSNDAVTASVGSSALPTVTAPSVGLYTLVPGDTSTYAVQVDGVAVANLPSATFSDGGDYTIIAYGSASSPSVAVLQDRNQPVSGGDAADVRLVNAAVANGDMTLTTNYLPVNVDVPYGTASSYSPVSYTFNSLLQITSPVSAFPTYSASGVSLVGGGVYTVFALGTTTAPLVFFEKDR